MGLLLYLVHVGHMMISMGLHSFQLLVLNGVYKLYNRVFPCSASQVLKRGSVCSASFWWWAFSAECRAVQVCALTLLIFVT